MKHPCIKAILLAALTAAGLGFGLAATALGAQGWDKSVEFVQSVGRIDWETGTAVASGIGLPPRNVRSHAQRQTLARRAAVIDARRNLMEVVGAVRIDSTTKVLNSMVASDVIRTSVSGMLQGSRVTSERQMPDGSFVVEVSAPIRPSLAAQALRQEKAHQARTGQADNNQQVVRTAAVAKAPVMEQDISEESPSSQAPAALPATALASGPAPDYTGLVIDARGTGFAPSLVPTIKGPDGALYPSSRVDEDVAAENGLVRYFSDMAQAQQSDRAGNKPLTVKARAAEGSSELTLSQEDADLLSRILADPGNPLSRAQVVVVF